ncbi:amidohydrolase family protein [Leifsonia sp. Leaf264]|uniref:amidohydrolase family protein n=1 Tax=Leifsonia sp. Leaf264 TaxID=1736314 RepID=UPI0006F38FAC|nr:amidohydrolase family protein [Leifsonia sp. Leaf264]KQO95701.1 metal-dependent hydrolase [Leifsonia sp. Leaf264]
MSLIIDAHQHVWDLQRAEYAWLGPDAGILNRSIPMGEVLPSFEAAGVTGSVLVQAADNDEDTEYMLEVARRSPQVLGVVGYVPLHQPERAAERLAELQREPLFCGVRNLIHDRSDPHWLLRDDVDATLGLLEDAGVPFDVVGVLPEHLRAVIAISERHPRLRMVLDHLNKPPIGAADSEPWRSLIARAAENPLVFGKVSGLYSAVGDPASWTVDSIRPIFDHAMGVFGPDRLLYGGDWPVSLIAGGYDRVFAGIGELLADLDVGARDSILAGTAADFYSLDLDPLTGPDTAADLQKETP